MKRINLIIFFIFLWSFSIVCSASKIEAQKVEIELYSHMQQQLKPLFEKWVTSSPHHIERKDFLLFWQTIKKTIDEQAAEDVINSINNQEHDFSRFIEVISLNQHHLLIKLMLFSAPYQSSNSLFLWDQTHLYLIKLPGADFETKKFATTAYFAADQVSWNKTNHTLTIHSRAAGFDSCSGITSIFLYDKKKETFYLISLTDTPVLQNDQEENITCEKRQKKIIL